jgi:co-chaperonin GroES (HSP10)
MKYGDDAPGRYPHGRDRALSAPAASLRAMNDFVLFERDSPPTEAAGLILVSDEPSTMATVVSVGPGKWCAKADVFVPNVLKPGDRVVLDKNAKAWETHTTADGRVLTAMREGDVVAVVES